MSELLLQSCPHCLTALRFKPGYAIDETTKCPECARHLLQTTAKPAPPEKKPATPVAAEPIPRYKRQSPLPQYLQSRVTAFFLLALTATIFVLVAIVKPALEARTQAMLHEMRQSNEEEPVTSVLPPPPTTPTIVQIEPETVPELPAAMPDAVSPSTPPQPLATPVPDGTVAILPEFQPPTEPATPVKPPEPTPLERLEKALAIPVNRYAVTEPVILQELLYDFEEMLNCSIHADKLTETQREKLQQKIAPFELKQTSLKATLDRLLQEVGLMYHPSDDGQLHLSTQP